MDSEWITQDPTQGRPRLSRRDELITCALLTWMIAGLHLDGWAHQNRDLNDSITTPWHGLGLVGVATFLAGGVGDQIWHLALGVEQDLEAFLSPTHRLATS